MSASQLCQVFFTADAVLHVEGDWPELDVEKTTHRVPGQSYRTLATVVMRQFRISTSEARSANPIRKPTGPRSIGVRLQD